MAGEAASLPAWARELVGSYESGAACQFILHGNVHDRVLVPGEPGAALGNLRDFLLGVLLVPFDVVLSYDLGNGVRVERGGETFATWPALQRLGELPRAPRPAVEALTHYLRFTANLARLGKQAPKVAVLIDAAELIAPAGDAGGYDLGAIVLLLREWANDSLISGSPAATFLVVENLNDLHPLLASNAHAAKVKLPLPDEAALGDALRVLEPAYAAPLAGYAGRIDALAHQLAGVALSSVEQLLKNCRYEKRAVDPAGLVALKKSLVENDYSGLIGFVESRRTLDDIAGSERVKAWLRQDIALWKQDDLKALPMGYLFCGPVGTGKTFFVECLAGEAGVPVVKMKNFRDKWVGSTEGNLERIFRLLHALGRCIVFVDEADQALGRRDASASDSGVSGRIYSMIAEEMSDTDNRGRILWILASSRPDLIEVDIKRPGRIDVKIPLFPTLEPHEGFALLRALCRRAGLAVPEEAFAGLEAKIPEMLTPGAAEAIAVKAYRIARTQGLEPVPALAACLEGYQLPVPRDVMDFQIGLAVREASDLEFVPEKLRPSRGQAPQGPRQPPPGLG